MTISVEELEHKITTNCADMVVLLRSRKVPESEIAYALEMFYVAGELGTIKALKNFINLAHGGMSSATQSVLEVVAATLLDVAALHEQETGALK